MHQDLSRNLTRLISLLDWLQTPMNYIISALQGIYNSQIKHCDITFSLIAQSTFLSCLWYCSIIRTFEMHEYCISIYTCK